MFFILLSFGSSNKIIKIKKLDIFFQTHNYSETRNISCTIILSFFHIRLADRTRLAYVTAVAVGAGTAMFFIWWWWTRRQKPQPPSRWRKVGELSDLIAFPIKSLGPIRMMEMECTILGLKYGWMRDRTLMVIDLDGHFVTARQLPKMVQVSKPSGEVGPLVYFEPR
jgi:hypothetical protein